MAKAAAKVTQLKSVSKVQLLGNVENLVARRDGNKLLLEIDLTPGINGTCESTKSGKAMMLSTTRGFARIDGISELDNLSVSMNVTFKD